MAAQCVTLPTLTRVDQQVGQQVVQTQVPFVSTLPPSFITNTGRAIVCSTNTTSPTTSICSATLTTSVETVAGGTTVITITTEVTNPVTTSVTTTLFSTSCSETSPNPVDSSTPTQPTDTPVTTPTTTPITTPNTTPVTTPFTTPTTTPTGRVSASDTSSFVSTQTTTSTGIGPSPTTQNDSNGNQSSRSNLGAIVGGSVGGFVGLLALALLAWFFFKKAHGHKHFKSSSESEKGPFDDGNSSGYQYGLLGSGNAIGPAPPSGTGQETAHQLGSNETGYQPDGHVNQTGPYQPTGNETGYQPTGNEVGYQPTGNEVGYQPTGNEVGYQPTGNEAGYQPTGNEVGYQPTGNEVGYQPTGNETGYQPDPQHIRGLSLAPLLGAIGAGVATATAAAAGAAATTSSSRPSTSSSTHPLISPNQQQQGYSPNAYSSNPTLSTGPTYGGRYGSDHSHGYGSVPGHSPNTSAGASWAAPQPQGLMAPIIGGPAAMRYSQEEDRSGSPVSIQEQRVLQVINPDTSLGFESAPVASGSFRSPAYGDGSSAGATPAPTPAPALDGKGRPLNLTGQLVPLVHLDGGRYEEPFSPTPASGAALPPAYYNP